MLVDCDNFFVSCERIFQPKLKNRPVVVLSNNDGCVVSRSYEAKKAGIPMCAPYFKIASHLKALNGVALSSNYELYADISGRLMSFLRSAFVEIETYSIDEAFLKIPFRDDFFSLASELRTSVLNQIGIPVSIGMAPTKTLCKIASQLAKQNFKIWLLSEPRMQEEVLAQTEVADIWGIGRRTASKLHYMGIFTALELCKAPATLIRSKFGINLAKTVMELQGTPCQDIEQPEPQKSIISSGSFEYEVNRFEQLEQNLAEFVDCACQRLRHQNSVAGCITIGIYSNRFNHHHPQYNNSLTISLPQPSDNTARFMTAMKQGLEQIYRDDCWYKRAGVVLSCLEDSASRQKSWFTDFNIRTQDQKLMNAFDELNGKFGRKTVFFAVQNAKPKQYLKREFKSPAFTTSWDELPLVS